MKIIRRNYGINMTPNERIQARRDAQDTTITRGTDRKPDPPRDVIATAAPRGVLLNWRPPFYATDLAGYRVYKDSETSLFAEIRDPLATQHFVDCTAGTTPPTTNFFISSVSKIGRESQKVMIQGSATAETGAPAMPVTPPTYTTDYAPSATSVSRYGGACFSGNTRVFTLHRLKPIEELVIGDRVCSRLGWKRVAFVEVHDFSGEMIDMGKGELVTPEHLMFAGYGYWKPAAEVLKNTERYPRVEFSGKVYNLELDTPSKLDDDHCYRLVNGRFAHNLKPYGN
ncbi:MAG: hypothetical protein JO356_01085 [Acidobacteria bacterium]|nr:hypothetical protein [Acidobacteriota bacterium]